MQDVRRHQFKVLGMVVCAMMTLPACTVRGKGTLVKDGRPAGCIVIREDLARGKLLTAARDLAGYLEKMSGAVVPLVWETDHCPGFRIYVGPTRLEPVDPATVTADNVGFDGFIIKSVDDGVLIAGRTDRGTANGVYHFAEHVLGVRWLTLEEDEPTYPQTTTIDVPKLDMTVKPDFEWRGQYYTININYLPKKHMENHALWSVFNRLWGIDGNMAHIFFGFVPDSLFDTHPEYFALIDGKRTKGRVNVQRCLSNPDVLQLAIDYSADFLARHPEQRFASLSGNDGGGWCECDNCAATGPTQAHRSFAFANAVAEALEERLPNRGICVIAYQGTIEPPLDMKLHPNVVPWLCPMGKCRVHSIHSDCPDAVAKRRIVRGWQKLAGRFYWYPYLYGGPFTGPAVLTMAEEMRFMRDHGCRGGFREHTAGPQTNWALLNWMEVKLQWDVDQDPVRLRRQFIEGYYGQLCADAVEQVYDQVETELRNMPKAAAPDRPYGHNNMGGAYFGPVVKACQAEIDAAFEAARGEANRKFAKRVVIDMANLVGGVPEDLKAVVQEQEVVE